MLPKISLYSFSEISTSPVSLSDSVRDLTAGEIVSGSN
jgi:hypothetical protein